LLSKNKQKIQEKCCLQTAFLEKRREKTDKKTEIFGLLRKMKFIKIRLQKRTMPILLF